MLPFFMVPLRGVIYVSNGGSDTNDGFSTDTPFLTLAKADSVARPGMTVALKRGDVWSSDIALRISHGGVAGFPVVWDGNLWGSGANAVIQAAADGTDSTFYSVVNITRCQYLTFQNITVDGNNKQKFGLVIGGPADYFSLGPSQTNESHITVQDCTIKNCGNGTSYRLTLSVKPWSTDMDNIIIQRCVIDGSDDEALSFYPARSDLGATPSAIKDSYIGYNTITNYGRRNAITSVGLHVNNKASNILIERNTITTGPNGSSRGFGMLMDNNEPIPGIYATGVTIRYNDVRVTEGNWALGFTTTQAGDFQVYYNKFSSLTTCTDTSAGGINIMASTPDYIGGDIKILNNVIYTTGGRGINSGNTADGAVTLKNNLVYNTGADTNHYGIMLGDIGKTIYTNNAIRMADPDRTCVRENGIYYKRADLTAWDGWAIAGDPLLTDPVAYDFTLQLASAAIDAGAEIGFSVDFAGAPVPVHIKTIPPSFAEFLGWGQYVTLPLNTGNFDYWFGGRSLISLPVDTGGLDYWFKARMPPSNPAQTPLPDCGVYEYQ
jgi:hypothetical protein